MQEHYTTYERDGQVVLATDNEIILPENAPVRLTSAQLEEPDCMQLYRAYSPKGRKSAADPRVTFKAMVYGYQCGRLQTHLSQLNSAQRENRRFIIR